MTALNTIKPRSRTLLIINLILLLLLLILGYWLLPSLIALATSLITMFVLLLIFSIPLLSFILALLILGRHRWRLGSFSPFNRVLLITPIVEFLIIGILTLTGLIGG